MDVEPADRDFQSIRKNKRLKWSDLLEIHDCEVNIKVQCINCSKIKINSKDTMPCLDVNLKWGKNDKIKFSVFCKPNQVLKHVLKESQNNLAVIKNMPLNVLERLMKITTLLEEDE